MLPMHIQRGPSNNTPEENLELLLDSQITFGSLIIREVRRFPLTKEQRSDVLWRYRGETLPFQLLCLADKAGVYPSRLGQIIAEQSPQRPTRDEITKLAIALGYTGEDIGRMTDFICRAPTPEPDWRERARHSAGPATSRHKSKTISGAAGLNHSTIRVVTLEDATTPKLTSRRDVLHEMLQLGEIEISQFYQRRREYLELPINHMATKTGIPEKTLTRLERESNYRVNYPQLKRLAEVLDVPVKDLLAAHKRHARSS